MGLWSGKILVKKGWESGFDRYFFGRVLGVRVLHGKLVLETSVAFIVCIERKNEVFCGYSTDSVGCCVLH